MDQDGSSVDRRGESLKKQRARLRADELCKIVKVKGEAYKAKCETHGMLIFTKDRRRIGKYCTIGEPMIVKNKRLGIKL